MHYLNLFILPHTLNTMKQSPSKLRIHFLWRQIEIEYVLWIELKLTLNCNIIITI